MKKGGIIIRKLTLLALILFVFVGCTSESSKAECEIKDVKKIAFFTNDDIVNKINVEEYEVAVDLSAYEETKGIRQEHMDMVNEVKGISASESLKVTRSTKKYTIDFDQINEEVRDLLTNEYNFGSDMSLLTLVKNYESIGYVCK